VIICVEFIRSKVLGVNRVSNEYIVKYDEIQKENAAKEQRQKEERERQIMIEKYR